MSLKFEDRNLTQKLKDDFEVTINHYQYYENNLLVDIIGNATKV